MRRKSNLPFPGSLPLSSDENESAPLSSSLNQSPRSPGLFSNVFRRSNYRRANTDDLQEMAHLKNDVNSAGLGSPPLGSPLPGAANAHNDPIGQPMTSSRRISLHRVPVGSKDVSPVTSPLPDGGRRSPSVSITTSMWERPGTIQEHDTHDAIPLGYPQGHPSPFEYTKMDAHSADVSDHPPPAEAFHSGPGPRNSFQDTNEDDDFSRKYAQPPNYCSSKRQVKVSKADWLSLTIYALSVYSTIMSAIWFVVAILQPRWGHQISSRRGLEPASATLLAALAAKTIEISFVTVFVACLGQVLSRKSYAKNSRGVTLAEMTMRNWVIQPGSLITHFESLPYAGTTVLGALSLTATIAALLYTTASDAMVSPKLKYGDWEFKTLAGHVRSSYANVAYVKESCASVLSDIDENTADSCIGVQFSGQSYRNLLSFMNTWSILQDNETVVSNNMAERPVGTMLLYDNTTLVSTWVETDHSDIGNQFEKSGRIINNVTLSFPHPGVYAAATSPLNDILQPDDLSGVGEYNINAAVVSPTINVMCVNMDADELKPLVYTAWPIPKNDSKRVLPTHVGNQTKPWEYWRDDLPLSMNDKGELEFLNKTSVDDIFKWGKKYNRRPPVFGMYPSDFNLVTNSTVMDSDSFYIMAKNNQTANYTVCELRSWVSPNCMTKFSISGTGGARMNAVCEKDWDSVAFHPDFSALDAPVQTVTDWKWVADSWGLSMDLNGGSYNNNASNARILTQLALTKPELPSNLPSLAEALAAFASSTIVIGAVDTPFDGVWRHTAPKNILSEPGAVERFQASLTTQQYTSGHTQSWQKAFYVVLLLVFAINLFCFIYLVVSSGPVTDFTEPQNLFALAINSPPTAQLQGSCGGGPEKRDLVVPWRVAHAPSVNHYFFEEANERPWRGKYSKEAVSSTADYGETGNPKSRASVVMNRV